MKNNRKLPLFITLSVICAVFVGVFILVLVKHIGKKNSLSIEYPDVKAYFEERAEIVSITPVKDSKNTLSEKSVVAELKERGFNEYPITADYDINGGFDNPVDASEDSSVKHPMYMTYYETSDNELWVIHVVDGRFSANPASYNIEHTDIVPIKVSESEEIASYDASTNSIYITKPFDTTFDVRVVDRIDAETLEALDLEE
jgi:hypothetical protein